MKFSTDNYQLQYSQHFPFTIHTESTSPIFSLKKTNISLLYTNNIEINIHDKKKKLYFDNNTCCIEANEKIIIAGDENGQIKVFDYKKRIINVIEYNSRINEIKILDNTFLVVGNDLNVCIFEYFSKEPKILYKHEDFVKCCDYRNNLVVTGSIDKILIIFNTDTNIITKIAFENSISKVRFVDDNRILVVSKYKIFIVDIQTSQIINSCYVHTKETTGLIFYKDRIYTSSLDGNLKSWTIDLKLISQIKFDDKILCFDILKDISYVGLSNGSIYKLDNEKKIEKEIPVKKQVRRYYTDEDDKNIKRPKIFRKKQSEIEKLINNNQHWLAFTKIFSEPDIDIIYGVLFYIKTLNGLKKMMIDRNSVELGNLFDFIIDTFHYVEMRGLFVELMVISLSLYSDLIMQNEELLDKIDYLNELLDQELKFQSRAIELTGYIECVMLNK